MAELRLVIFDVDGTLVDSEADIVLSMTRAFAAADLPAPDAAQVRAVIGLSVELAVARIAPAATEAQVTAAALGYRDAYRAIRERKGAAEMSPLFPGARALLDRLHADPWTLLAVATGKSRRGLDALLDGHGLRGHFVSTQTADEHPSKPNPSMIAACLADTGADRARTVMIGDTTYDMDMARAAGVGCIAVSWGAHPPQALTADARADSFDALPGAIAALTGEFA